MMQNNERQTLRQFVIDNFLFGQAGNLSDRDSLLDKGIIDSIGIFDLIAFIEKQFQIKVADEDLIEQNFDSIDNLVGFLTRRTAAAA